MLPRFRLFVGFSLVCCFTAVVGCGGPRPPKREFADVAGKISYKGQALKTGTVTFQPAVGAPVVANIDPDGSYTMKGVIGPNSVMVENRPPDPGPGGADPAERKAAREAAEKAKDVIVPDKFSTPGSGLKFDVKAGANVADFDLKE